MCEASPGRENKNYEIQGSNVQMSKAAPGLQVPLNLKYPRVQEMRATMKEEPQKDEKPESFQEARYTLSYN